MPAAPLQTPALLPAALLLLLAAVAAADPAPVPPAPLLRIDRLEFSCLAPEHERPAGPGTPRDAAPVYQVFDVWDEDAAGFHPALFDVAVYVTNGEASAVGGTELALSLRYMIGPVVRYPAGEFAGLIDLAASRERAGWIAGPAPYLHRPAPLPPGQARKINFRNLSLRDPLEAARRAGMWLWRVELTATLRRPDRDLLGQPAPLGRLLEVLPDER
ncbi:MAG: hypothetical protein HZA54_16350 [Planctomycetes bacterium]|nr:hypothetical protein [Planctomycetota bacterium]